ncbi:MAG: hydroxyquinol 1,2-dioxygenase [Novosphingobium sp.]|jgi:hypothetical protein
MATTPTKFGSLEDFSKGRVEIINDDPRNYVFSNVFEVATVSAPYERVAVGQNLEYVIEAARAEGQSPWFSCAHDEFALCMDGEIEVHFVKLPDPAAVVDPASEGAVRLADEQVSGEPMGRVVLRRGHMAMLPFGSAYRFQANRTGVVLFQTIVGDVTVMKWADICQTEPA